MNIADMYIDKAIFKKFGGYDTGEGVSFDYKSDLDTTVTILGDVGETEITEIGKIIPKIGGELFRISIGANYNPASEYRRDDEPPSAILYLYENENLISQTDKIYFDYLGNDSKDRYYRVATRVKLKPFCTYTVAGKFFPSPRMTKYNNTAIVDLGISISGSIVDNTDAYFNVITK